MDRNNYTRIKDIVIRSNTENCLKNKIFIVGGVVPYLVFGKDSNRKHSDLDIVVDIKI